MKEKPTEPTIDEIMNAKPILDHPPVDTENLPINTDSVSEPTPEEAAAREIWELAPYCQDGHRYINSPHDEVNLNIIAKHLEKAREEAKCNGMTAKELWTNGAPHHRETHRLFMELQELWKFFPDVENKYPERLVYFLNEALEDSKFEGKTAKELGDWIDLMRDEFMRIRSCPNSSIEIQQLCDRAITKTEQTLPILTQRDKYQAQLAELKSELFLVLDLDKHTLIEAVRKLETDCRLARERAEKAEAELKEAKLPSVNEVQNIYKIERLQAELKEVRKYKSILWRIIQGWSDEGGEWFGSEDFLYLSDFLVEQGLVKYEPYEPDGKHEGYEISGMPERGEMIYIWNQEALRKLAEGECK